MMSYSQTATLPGNKILRGIGWYQLTFKERILFAFVLVMSLVIVTGWAFLAWSYRREKIAYIYENHFLRTDVIAQRSFATLVKEGDSEPFVPSTLNPAEIPKLYKIPRLPERGEYFVANSKGKFFVLSLDSVSGSYRRKTLSRDQQSFFESGDGFAYLSTLMGDLIATTRPDVVKQENFQNRSGLKRALESGLVQGFFTIKEKKNEIAFGYREIAGTNLLVFVETSLDAVLAPVNRFLAIWLVIGIATTALGILLMLYTLRGLAKPVEVVLENLMSIARTQYDFSPNYIYNDEFQKIFSGLSWMSGELSAREQGLLHLQRRLQEIVNTTQSMAGANERQNAAFIAAQSIVKELGFFKAPSVHVIMRNENELSSFPVMQKGEKYRSSDIIQQLPKEALALKKMLLELEDDVALLKGNFLAVRFSQTDLLHAQTLLFSGCETSKLRNEDLSFLRSLSLSLSICFENLAYREKVAQAARLEMEIETAQVVQASLIHPPLDIPQIQQASIYHPAAKIGGDWFGHYHDKERGLLNVYIGDVTGHGIASALMTGVACGAVYASERLLDCIDQTKLPESKNGLQFVAEMANWVLLRTGKMERFMTMVFISIDLKTGMLSYVNAGHRSFMLRKKSTGKVQSIMNQTDMLGAMDSVHYEVRSVQLEAGDLFLMYTDGLVENTGPSDERVTERALKKLLASAENVTAAHDLVSAESAQMWKETALADDATALFIQWSPSTQSATEAS